MGVDEALDFADKLIFAKTGKHLNDLEREVFLGSWQGHTYEKMYPLNPEYVERDVGYKLWKKLSNALEEKVSKKNFRGALERAFKQQQAQVQELLLLQNQAQAITKKVFISHWSQEPDLGLVAQLCKALNAAGHQTLTATVGATPRLEVWSKPVSDNEAENFQSPPQPTTDNQTPHLPSHLVTSPRVEHDWLTHIDAQLEQCDYFLLLLSPQAAVSEMVIEELRRVKQLQESRYDDKPVVLPIRVNCPHTTLLNHDLRSYLHGIGQREWNSPADTSTLIQDVLNLLKESGEWIVSRGEAIPADIKNPDSSGECNLSSSTAYSRLPTPLPVAEPELPNGQVRLASAFYVERVPCETLCYKEILQPGALIRIKAPRQMGKTSLLARILCRANEQGYRTVPLSFQHADAAVFTNLNELLQWFCARITRKLRLRDRVEEYWTDTYGDKDNCTIYFEDYLLSQLDSPLVLGLDEVDRVFQYPKIADDFFGLLRAWYEEASYGAVDSDLWEKLRLVVVHSTEVYVPLNVNQSPFNVGLPIALPEFTREQVQDLTQRHGLSWNTFHVQQLMSLVGGHPYLVRLALYHVATGQITLDQLLQTAATEGGLYGDHLRRHLWNLQQHPELAVAFTKLVLANEPVELESVLAFKLHSMGLVQLHGNQVTPRFQLYQQYFRDRLLVSADGSRRAATSE